MYVLDFDHKGQTSLNFIEFLFNERNTSEFIYARNIDITLPLSKAILNINDIPFLAPELALLYKSNDILREGYQLDYDMALYKMSTEQKKWLKNSLHIMNPSGHQWLAACE